MAIVSRSKLVDALAAVAVSALSEPLGAIGVSAACELVKILWDARGRTSEEKELQKQVRAAITAWAKGESLDPYVVDRGLAWAIEYVQAAGCQHELIAEADFDPTRAAEAVLTQAKARDKHWGTDPEYGVAERAVHTTYNALCPKLKAEGGVVLAAIQASRNEIRGSIDQLREELRGVANRHELIDYLEKQIPDWDYSPWTQGRQWTQDRRPSQLERTLEITDKRRAMSPAETLKGTLSPNINYGQQRTMSPAEALEGVWLLTVLGGPSSGKTWLAQRLAREAAETALEQLRDPRVDPASVELPLFTTVAEWIKRHGTGFEGLVEAALPNESQQRIRRLVLRPGARVLAVADSLDEGVSVNNARRLLNSLTSSPTRRLVVTSRPEAWNSATAGLRTKQDTRVGTLTELRYPKDVHGYVKAWFTENPPTAQHLIRQLEERHELRTTATSPLLLTFYCMLTEQEPDQELPRRRRELYRTIIDLLLAGGWATTEKPVDTDTCRAILQQWAWDAVKDAVTPTGLGVWPETITTDRTPLHASAAMERALDNVAPKQEYPLSHFHDRAQVERRFLHRTLWEYLVSEHIATTFSAAKAAKALLPHIWFDPEWRVTLPMAIAAHKKRSKLVDRLWAYHTDRPTPTQKVVNDRLEELILEVAAQTDPEDWNKTNQSRIRALRESHTPGRSKLVASSAHWNGTNRSKAILAALNCTDPNRIPGLVRALLELEPTDKERAEARRSILTALPKTDLNRVPNLASTCSELEPTDKKRTETRQTIPTTLTPADVLKIHCLTEALSKLEPSNEERTKARRSIIAALPNTIPLAVASLVHVLSALEPNEEEQEKARQTILAALPNTSPKAIPILLSAFPVLKPDKEEQAKARQTILRKLPNADPWEISNLLGTFPALEPDDEERAEARQTILAALPNADPFTVVDLLRLLCRLSELEPSNEERTKARQVIITTLSKTKVIGIHFLTRELRALGATDDEWMEVRQTILRKLPNADPWEISNLLGTFPTLEPDDEERAEARQTILAALPNTTPGTIPDLVHGLSVLEPTNEEQSKARQTILAALLKATPEEINRLIRTLSEFQLDDAEWEQARQTIITALPHADSGTLYGLVGLLRLLYPVHDWLAALGIEST